MGFDARGLSARRRTLRTGVENYASYLLSSLADVQPDLTLFQARGAAPVLPERSVRRVYSGLAQSGVAWGLFGLGLQTFRAKIDVLVIPEQYVPIICNARASLVVVHDVAFRRYPTHYRRDLLLKLKVSTALVTRLASHIVADSAITKVDLVNFYGIEEKRISVVPLGCDHELYHPRERAESAHILDRLGVRGTYLLYVGSLHPRKNLLHLIRALAYLTEFSLVFAGKDTGFGSVLLAEAARLNVRDRVVLLGYVDDDIKAHLMAQACAFLFPSYYEGFGLPVLEAMASGAPVVASKSGAIPEVVGDTGALVQPGDLLGLVEAVRATTNPTKREAIVTASLARARTFTWSRTARAILEIANELGTS